MIFETPWSLNFLSSLCGYKDVGLGTQSVLWCNVCEWVFTCGLDSIAILGRAWGAGFWVKLESKSPSLISAFDRDVDPD